RCAHMFRSLRMLRSLRGHLVPLALVATSLAACDRNDSQGSPASPSASAPASASAAVVPAKPKIDRAEFNRRALQADVPLFWAADSSGDGVPQKDELRTLLFYPTSDSLDVDKTLATVMAYEPVSPPGLPKEEAQRRQLVRENLDQGALSLIYTDLRAATPVEK